MKREILYSAAYNSAGVLTKVSDAIKDENYDCPECKGKLILKRSGKTGKGSRRPHFSHSVVSPNCTPESVLHFSFKRYLFSYIESLLESHQALAVSWTCTACGVKQSGNLLESVVRVEEEFDLSICRPDIALIDASGSLVAAIEIVVTHPPEPTTIYHYREADVVLVQVNLESDEDLDHILEKISNPSIFDYCSRQSCSNFGISTTTRTVIATGTRCRHCLSPIEVYSINVQTPFGPQTTLDFSTKEIELVKSQRPNVEVREDRTTGEKFPVSDCIVCKQIQARYRPRRRRF